MVVSVKATAPWRSRENARNYVLIIILMSAAIPTLGLLPESSHAQTGDGFDFSISADPGSLIVKQGNSASSTITLTMNPSNSDCEDVLITATWLGGNNPGGAQLSFSGNGDTAQNVWYNPWSTQLDILTSSSTKPGIYYVHVQGTEIDDPSCYIIEGQRALVSPDAHMRLTDALTPGPVSVFTTEIGDPYSVDIQVKITNPTNIFQVSSSPVEPLILEADSSTTSTLTLTADVNNPDSPFVTLSSGSLQGQDLGISYEVNGIIDKVIGPGESATATLKLDAPAASSGYTSPTLGLSAWIYSPGSISKTPVSVPVQPEEVLIDVAVISFGIEVYADASTETVMQGSEEQIPITIAGYSTGATAAEFDGVITVDPIFAEWLGGVPDGVSIVLSDTDLEVTPSDPETIELTISSETSSDTGNYDLRIWGEIRGENGNVIASGYYDIDVAIQAAPFVFDIASSPQTLELEQGDEESSVITVSTSANNLGPIQITLAADWLGNAPSSTSLTELTVTSGSLDPGDSFKSLLGIEISKAAPAGDYVIRVTATATYQGGQTSLKTLDIPIKVFPHASSFVLNANPPIIGIDQGATGSSTITVLADEGNPGPIDIALSSDWAPSAPSVSGMDHSLGTTMIDALQPGESRQVTVSIKSFTSSATGTFPLRITGQGIDPNGIAISPLFVDVQITVAPFDFEIRVSQQELPVFFTEAAETTAELDLDVILVRGSPQPVTLAASGGPEGTELEFSRASGQPTFSTELIVSVNREATLGSYEILLTGTGGGISHTETVRLDISDRPPFDFSINLSSESTTLKPGQEFELTASVDYKSGDPQPVFLTLELVPLRSDSNPMITHEFNLNDLSPTFTSEVTVRTDPSIEAGSYGIRIVGTGGSVVRSAEHMVIVVGTYSVIVDANPRLDGLVSVDSLALQAEDLPKTFEWYPIDEHVIRAVEAQEVDKGTRYAFGGWNDGSASTERSIVANEKSTFVGSFEKEYYLEIVSPYGSPGGSDWYSENERALVSIEPEDDAFLGLPQVFQSWTLEHGTEVLSPEAVVVMDGPKTIIANWKSIYPVELIAALAAAPAAVIGGWILALQLKAPWIGFPVILWKVHGIDRIRRGGTSYLDIELHNVGLSAANRVKIEVDCPQGIRCIDADEPIIIRDMLARESRKIQLRLIHTDPNPADRNEYMIDIIVKSKARVFFIIPITQKLRKSIVLKIHDVKMSLVKGSGEVIRP